MAGPPVPPKAEMDDALIRARLAADALMSPFAPEAARHFARPAPHARAPNCATVFGLPSDQRSLGSIGGRVAGRVGVNRFVAGRTVDLRSKCTYKGCRRPLVPGDWRIGKMSPSVRHGHNLKTKWYHIPCIFASFSSSSKRSKTITSVADVEAFESLPPAERTRVEVLAAERAADLARQSEHPPIPRRSRALLPDLVPPPPPPPNSDGDGGDDDARGPQRPSASVHHDGLASLAFRLDPLYARVGVRREDAPSPFTLAAGAAFAPIDGGGERLLLGADRDDRPSPASSGPPTPEGLAPLRVPPHVRGLLPPGHLDARELPPYDFPSPPKADEDFASIL